MSDPPGGAAFAAAPAVGARPGPVATLPAARGSVARALTAFWQERRRPVPGYVLITAAGVGVMSAGLVVGHRAGLGVALAGLLVWAPAVPSLVRRRGWADLLLAALSVALVGVVAVRDAGWVVGLCVATAAGTAAVAATSARSAPAVLLAGASWATGVVRALPWLGQGLGERLGSRRRQMLGALRSVVVTGVLLTVFGLLFASADRVFASYLPRLDLDRLPAQVVVAALVGLGAVTMAHLALASPSWSRMTVRPGRAARPGEWLLPVVSLDLLVLGFVLVQVGALVGGHRYVRQTAGLSYAEYAREGFAQLVVVTALTLLVVAVAARRAPRASARDRLASRIALAVLCVGTLGVVASALRRMDLYVEAFGLTRLRLFVVVVELVLAAVLLLVMVAGVRWRAVWLPRAVVQVVALAMLGLAIVNPDAVIVRHNIAAELENGLDLGYLRGLSADAVPTIEETGGPLRSCLLNDRWVERPTGLADWNLGRERAARILLDGTAPGGSADEACRLAQR